MNLPNNTTVIANCQRKNSLSFLSVTKDFGSKQVLPRMSKKPFSEEFFKPIDYEYKFVLDGGSEDFLCGVDGASHRENHTKRSYRSFSSLLIVVVYFDKKKAIELCNSNLII